MIFKRAIPYILTAFVLVLTACNDDSSSDKKGGEDKPVNADTVTNDPCDENTEEFCDGEIAHFCNNDGKITLRDCNKLKTSTNPVSCHVTNDNFADCAEPCDGATFVQYTSCDGDYVAYHECEKTKDGGTHDFAYTNNPCAEGCYEGACVSGDVPVEGGKCTQSKCYGKTTAYLCQNGKYVKSECGENTVCAEQFGTHDPQCVTSCDGSSDDVYACTTVAGKPAQNNVVCRLGTDSRYYAFKETAVCKTSCDDGVCDVTVPMPNAPCDPDETSDICAYNSLYYCNSETKQIALMQCGVGDNINRPICRYKNEHYADCVIPCEEGDENLMSCGGSAKKKEQYTDNDICQKAADGEFYYFNDQKMCESGLCDDGVCQP